MRIVLRIEDRVVAITGAGRGIGRATAIAFAAAGAKVAVIDLDYDDADHTAKKIVHTGGKALAQSADVSQEIQVKKTIAAIVEKWGRLDILVNNAGIYRQGDALNTSIDDWNAVLAVNLTGAFLCSRESVSLMLKNGYGTIVNVASEAGLVGIKSQLAYNVSKAALIGLTRSMAVDHAPYIRVNCVCPGTTDTPLVAKALREAADPALMRRNLENSRPLDRLGKPEEIACAILLLASDSMGYATGAVLSVDGGYTSQ
jgi:NAD(P)-dependent dehydrogenase (short-subunit alcohol dehydrogenase family)